MNEATMPYEKTIDLKNLWVYILRKWRVVLLAVVVGAAVISGYKAVSGPKVVTDSARVKEIETLVKENETKIKNLQTELADVVKFQNNVAGLEYEVQTKENEIKAHITSLENLDRVIAAYESNLKEVQELSKAVVNPEVKAEIVSTMSTLQMEILSYSHQMLILKQEIENLEEEVAVLRKYLTEAEILQDSIDLLEEENEKLKKEDTQVTIAVSTADIIKFAILGAIAGGFIVCGVTFLQYFMNQKLYNAAELKDSYEMRILGDFYVPAAKKNKLDQLLDRMEGFGKAVDAEKEAALVAAKVQVLVPVDGEKKQIIVTGTLEDNMLKAVAQQIGKNLPAAEYEICVVQNPVYDADALLKIRQSIVVLVEARGVSVKKEIMALMDVIGDARAQVLGVIAQ